MAIARMTMMTVKNRIDDSRKRRKVNLSDRFFCSAEGGSATGTGSGAESGAVSVFGGPFSKLHPIQDAHPKIRILLYLIDPIPEQRGMLSAGFPLVQSASYAFCPPPV